MCSTCVLQTQAQTQGLQPYNGTACSQSCAITIDGLTGSAVAVDKAGTSYVCLPLSETSLLNRFGHTVSGSGDEQCVFNDGNQSKAADSFSCFCIFTTPVAAARRRLMQL